MFGHNEVVGQKFFREAAEARAGKLLVTSIFHTIQGEGPYAGCPAIFVRLAKCQLRCSFCDTYFDHGEWMTAEEILAAAERVILPGSAPPDLLVITGGEPALQATALESQFWVLTARSSPFKRLQFETNGLLSLPLMVVDGVLAAAVVSPKCAEVDGKPTHYLRPNAAVLERARCLKFVVTGDPGSPYHAVPNWALDWRLTYGRDVFISPMAEYLRTPEQARALYEARGAPDLVARSAAERVSFWEPGLLDMEKCRRNYEYAAAYALRNNLRLTMQMQLFASMP